MASSSFSCLPNLANARATTVHSAGHCVIGTDVKLASNLQKSFHGNVLTDRTPLVGFNNPTLKQVKPSSERGFSSFRFQTSCGSSTCWEETKEKNAEIFCLESYPKTSSSRWNALQEVDRVIDYTQPKDPRLFPYLRTARENFELALEADNSNTHARYWLSRLHLKYQLPGACQAVGAALLVEAANMGDPDAQYELGCRLRVESDQQAFYYLEKAVDQLHPGALYLLGAVYLAGDCVSKDINSAMWCFHRASEKVAKQIMPHCIDATIFSTPIISGAKVPVAITKFNAKRLSIRPGKKCDGPANDPVEKAKKQFQIAANAGCDLGLQWLRRLADNEKNLQASQ
ncbi:hypothetical protein ACLOJK_031988 [Asimina triloba]